MRAAYLDDLRSKFLLENSVLKMEYAEVRVLHLAHKVFTVRMPSLGPHPASPHCFLVAWPASLSIPRASAEALSGRPHHTPGFAFSLRCLSGHFFLCSLEQGGT